MPPTFTEAQLIDLLKAASKQPANSIDWSDIVSKAISVVSMAVSAVVAISALVVGHRWATANDEKKRKLEFVEKQLKELYGPLMGTISQIQHLSRYLREVDIARSHHVNEQMNESRPQFRSLPKEQRDARVLKIDQEGSAELSYNLDALRKDILPLYEILRDTLRDKFWLADEDVREQWPNLIKFIDSWIRTLDGKYNPEISLVYRVSEFRLQPFNRLVLWHFETLQRRLVCGNPDLPAAPLPAEPMETDELDRPQLFELIEGYDMYGGNIQPDRIQGFTSVILTSHTPQERGRDEFRFNIVDDNGDYRGLDVKIVRAKNERGSSHINLTLGFWGG